jgi:hypothetical protein
VRAQLFAQRRGGGAIRGRDVGGVFGNGVVHASLFLNNAAESSGGAIDG